MRSILNCTVVELSEKIKAGEYTAVEAMEAVFERIGEKEQEYHCYITLDRESALNRATEKDRGEGVDRAFGGGACGGEGQPLYKGGADKLCF